MAVDLLVHFGRQVRLQCHFCRRYMKRKRDPHGFVRCTNCGAAYTENGQGWTIREEPTNE